MSERSVHAQLIAKPGLAMTGTSRYTTELHRGLQEAGVDARMTFPVRAPIPRPLQSALLNVGLDTQAFFTTYPLHMPLDSANVYHITVQTMATLLLFQRFSGPVVVTALDIIPFQVRHDKNLNASRHFADRVFYRLALAGLRRAKALIAISQYTKNTLVDMLNLPAERIHVIPLGVNHERFRAMDVPDAVRARYGLEKEFRHVLYVGSDDPRKNLGTLIRAFAQVAQKQRDIRLLKVGAENVVSEREKLYSLIAELNIQEQVIFFDSIPNKDLPFFYKAADVFALPSLYEGFGLPILEAMACGTPVICSNTTSLPEVAGEAAILVNAKDDRELAEALVTLLNSPAERDRRSELGLKQASHFTWQQTVHQTLQVYSQLV